jgi:hypothetical protein
MHLRGGNYAVLIFDGTFFFVVSVFGVSVFYMFNSTHVRSESNLLEQARGLVRELFPNSFSISFSQAADWRRFCDLRNNVAFCQSVAWEKEIEKEFGYNSRTSPLACSKRLDSGLPFTFSKLDRHARSQGGGTRPNGQSE